MRFHRSRYRLLVNTAVLLSNSQFSAFPTTAPRTYACTMNFWTTSLAIPQEMSDSMVWYGMELFNLVPSSFVSYDATILPETAELKVSCHLWNDDKIRLARGRGKLFEIAE